MSQIEFENTGYEFTRPPQKKSFDLTDLIIKSGFVSDRKTANYVLLVIAVCALVVTLAFWPRTPHKTVSAPEYGAQIGLTTK